MRDGSASVEAPLGKVEIRVGEIREEAWVAVGLETVVEMTAGSHAGFDSTGDGTARKPWWWFWG